MSRSWNHCRYEGFTLTEIAIVLVIVALLLGGMMVPLSAQIDIRNSADTQKTLGDIRDALIGYAASHRDAAGLPFLPCPDTDNDGLENRAGNACTNTEGRVPWATLGVGQADGWNNRFRYRVIPAFSDTGFTLATPGTLRVCNDNVCSAIVASNVAATVVSHGPNGLGAFNLTGGTNAAPTSADELENTDGDDVFVSRTPDPAYDDIVIWLSPNLLFSRMIAAGRLP